MNKIFFLVALFLSSNVFAQKGNFIITNFGAKGDSITVNTLAIQQAIDEAAKAGGGKVIIPRGKFVTRVIYLKTGVELQLQKDAVLLGSTDRLDYGKGN